MKTKTIGFIGGGRIARIFLQGFKNLKVEFNSVTVYDTNTEILNKLKKDFPFIETASSATQVALKEVVFIALHPPVIPEVISRLKNVFPETTLIISLAPKFSIQKLSELTGSQRIARMIPNATSFINQGYNPVSFSDAMEKAEKKSVLEVMAALGNTFETEEKKLEAYAIASAMLPTYFWFQWKEMEHIAIKMGLSPNESGETVYETSKSALELMYNSNLDYEELNDLIPVKPIGENEIEIKEILNQKLLGLFNKIRP
jgi:pyrroline-5-carboxylate reductase